MKNIVNKRAITEEIEREWFARLLWRLFPSARSENELADLVAELLSEENRPIHPKTVRNWLRCDHAPAFRYVMRVIALSGVESVFEILDMEQP